MLQRDTSVRAMLYTPVGRRDELEVDEVDHGPAAPGSLDRVHQVAAHVLQSHLEETLAVGCIRRECTLSLCGGKSTEEN